MISRGISTLSRVRRIATINVTLLRNLHVGFRVLRVHSPGFRPPALAASSACLFFFTDTMPARKIEQIRPFA